MQITPKVLSTLSYLASLFDPQEEVLLSIKAGKVRMALSKDMVTRDIELGPTCALEDILGNLTNDMCTDCLKADYNFKNPFFIDLCKAYINSLIHMYGDEVPITRTLATRILEFKLYHGTIIARDDIKELYVLSPDSYLLDKSTKYQYFLLV